MDQRELVDRAGRGDHDAFALLVDQSITQLEAVARLILRDPELARDAVQDAYIRAWRDLPGLRDPDRLDNDVEPAAAAGMAAIFIRRGPWGWIQAGRSDPPQAAATIDGLGELPAVLAALG